MIALWTILAAIGFVILGQAVLPVLHLVFVIPFTEVGRRVRPLRIPMWFVGRYGGFLLEVAFTLYLTALVIDHVTVWGVGLYILNGLLLLSSFNVLYQFDVRTFETQSGIWAIGEFTDV